MELAFRAVGENVNNRSQKSHRQAWLDIYERRASDLTRFATLLVGSGDAEDVVANAMVSVLQTSTAATEDAGDAYLFRAISNTAKNHLRARGRRLNREDRAHRLFPKYSDDALDLDLRGPLATLSSRQREIVFLTYWLDLRPADVADHLGIAEGTVRSQLTRARRTLRGLIDVSPN